MPHPHRRRRLSRPTPAGPASLIAVLAISAAATAAAPDRTADQTAEAVPSRAAVADPPPNDDRFMTNRRGRAFPLPAEDEAFSFVVYGDRTGGPAAGVAVLADAVNDTNLLAPDLVMTVGDLVEGYTTADPWMRQMREFRGIMDGLDMPWFPVAGNHDIYWRGPDRPPEEHEGRYEEHFGPLWYAFRHKGCLFLVLYTDEPNPATGERNFNRAASQRMSPEQFAWLDTTLAENDGARHVFVFLHHPRWIGGNYGRDWDRVHERLVAAGNVSAVFAGHIHHMRSDPKDGIEYLALATVGGHQPGHSEDAGYLHQYHVVTVRDDHLGMAAFPVGAALDPRAITGQVSSAAAAVAQAAPVLAPAIQLDADGTATGTVTATLRNPSDLPVEFTVLPEGRDLHWRFDPDHEHGTIAPGGKAAVTFRADRSAAAIDETFRLPELLVRADVLAGGRRFSVRERSAFIEPTVRIPADRLAASAVSAAGDRGLDFDGRGDHLLVAPDRMHLPDGPITVEAWIRGDDFGGRRGLLAKTEHSEFGIFVSNGTAGFSVHLDGRYREARTEDVVLRRGRWHHLAGVYDGAEVRMYVDGRQVAARPASGKRTRNALPFIIGADVDGAGLATSHFDGVIDAVRISTVARYDGTVFDLDDAWTGSAAATDAGTWLRFDLDATYGPWQIDRSSGQRHAITRGTPDPVAGRRASTATPGRG